MALPAAASAQTIHSAARSDLKRDTACISPGGHEYGMVSSRAGDDDLYVFDTVSDRNLGSVRRLGKQARSAARDQLHGLGIEQRQGNLRAFKNNPLDVMLGQSFLTEDRRLFRRD